MTESDHPTSPFGDAGPLLIVAAATPLTDGGERLDEAAIWPYARFLVEHGADGVFANGSTGEGILLDHEERKRVAVVWRAALRGRLIVHCGAQTTAATADLAAHAAEIGADGVAVIPPPYFTLDDGSLADHLVAAAGACAPLPFFIYAFAARSGYPVTRNVVERVTERAPNLAGLKVSETPWEKAEPYFGFGLPAFVGQEPFIANALALGAIGAVSGIAAAYPEEVRAVLDAPSPEGAARLRAIRTPMEAAGSLIASAKHVLGRRGVPVGPDLRRPMHALTVDAASGLDAALAGLGCP